MRQNDFFAGKPVTSLQTMLRVIAGADQSVPMLTPDGVYGPETKRAVMEFQRLHGLPQTGIADFNTWNSIVSAFQNAKVNVSAAVPLQIVMDRDQVFLHGCHNRHVLLVQALLKTLAGLYENLDAPDLTGVYDDKTVAAIKQIQKMNGRTPSGIFDKETWRLCAGLYCTCVGNGDRQEM